MGSRALGFKEFCCRFRVSRSRASYGVLGFGAKALMEHASPEAL